MERAPAFPVQAEKPPQLTEGIVKALTQVAPALQGPLQTSTSRGSYRIRVHRCRLRWQQRGLYSGQEEAGRRGRQGLWEGGGICDTFLSFPCTCKETLMLTQGTTGTATGGDRLRHHSPTGSNLGLGALINSSGARLSPIYLFWALKLHTGM